MNKPITPEIAIEQPLPMQQDALQTAAQAGPALSAIIGHIVAELKSWNGDIPSDQDMEQLGSFFQQLKSTGAALNALKSIACGEALTPAHAIPLCAYARAFSRLEDSDLEKIASPVLSFVDRHRQVLSQASVLHGGRGYNNGDNGHSR